MVRGMAGAWQGRGRGRAWFYFGGVAHALDLMVPEEAIVFKKT